MISRRSLLCRSLLAAPAVLIAPRVRAQDAGTTPNVVLKPDMAQLFSDGNTQGTFAALRLKPRTLTMTDENRSRMRLIPASTFKIPNSLIALETGVVADPDTEIFRWDGKQRSVPEWNADQNLRTAIRNSTVWVYQEVARRIGEPRMRKYLEAFNYGNHDIGGGIDRFWLDGELRISAREQIDFIEKLLAGTLPLAPRTMALVRDIVPELKQDGRTIKAKTGAAFKDDKPSLGWLVGWTGEGEATTIFALNMDLHGAPDLARRVPIAVEMLARSGAFG